MFFPPLGLALSLFVLQIPTEACFFREVSLVVGLSEAPLFCAPVISCAFPSDTATVRSAHGNCTSREDSEIMSFYLYLENIILKSIIIKTNAYYSIVFEIKSEHAVADISEK